jgi:hypothetical protein
LLVVAHVGGTAVASGGDGVGERGHTILCTRLGGLWAFTEPST